MIPTGVTYIILGTVIMCLGAAMIGYTAGRKSVPQPAIPIEKLQQMMGETFALLDHIEASKDYRFAYRRFDIAKNAGFDLEYNLTEPEKKEGNVIVDLSGRL